MSAREAEVLAALGEHLTNAEIAARLFISVRTVESHVSSLLRKLQLSDRRALAAAAGNLRPAPGQATGEQAPGGTPAVDGWVPGGRASAPPAEVALLPAPLTSFVGRAAERAALAAALREHRLVTAIGPGGVGKTRLALAVTGDVGGRSRADPSCEACARAGTGNIRGRHGTGKIRGRHRCPGGRTDRTLEASQLRGGITMIHPGIQAMLVRERSATLMAAAAAYRRGRQARSAATEASRAANRTAPHKTAERGQVVPRDGSAMLIRPVRGADAPLLADGFTRLSERSRWLRCLGRKRTLTEADLRFFTDVDHRDHEALGALDHVRGGGVVHRGSGIAEYEIDLDGTSSRAD